MTQCSEKTMHFKHLGARDVVADFAGEPVRTRRGAS